LAQERLRLLGRRGIETVMLAGADTHASRYLEAL
jgi:hypothetical protein